MSNKGGIPKTLKEEMYEQFLEWREIETPCEGCGGCGVKVYPNTSTWLGGVSGQALTTDVCNKCWGSGDQNKTWTNLKKVYQQIKLLEMQVKELEEEQNRKFDMQTVKYESPSEHCQRTRLQNCHFCDSPTCCDNQSPLAIENKKLKDIIEELNYKCEGLEQALGPDQ